MKTCLFSQKQNPPKNPEQNKKKKNNKKTKLLKVYLFIGDTVDGAKSAQITCHVLANTCWQC